MCRFAAYMGHPIPLDELLYRPSHSIIHQSTHAMERKEPLNGDGWGVGWYDPRRSEHPGLYRTLHPAWSDANMRHISPLIETPLFLAHVRAASDELPVHQLNCHPFRGGQPGRLTGEEISDIERARRRLLFMHNGRLAGYRRIVRHLHAELPEDLFFSIQGSTDSEHIFALVQDELAERALDPSAHDLAEAVQATLVRLQDLKRRLNGLDEPTHINCCVTDGRSLVATRYLDLPDHQAPSLYVGQAHRFSCRDGSFHAERPGETGAILIASERLWSDERVWQAVPSDHMLVVDEHHGVRMEALEAAG